MKKFKLISFLLAIALSLAIPAFAETIVLKSGKTVDGKILQRTDQYIKVDVYGVSLTYYFDEIESIIAEATGGVLESITSSTSFGAGRAPSQIFDDVASSVVVITTRSADGGLLGSGFIVSGDGIIVTNFHVVANAEGVDVKLKNGKSYPVTGVVDYDPVRDICVLKIDARNLDVMLLGSSDNLIQGQKVLVIGAPLGLEYSISDGLFSGRRDSFGQEVIQFTAPISPGNSGGPLLNIQGKAIGITTFTNVGGQNLNFAVPIEEAKKYIHSYPKMSFREFVTGLSGKYSLYNLGCQLFMAGNTELAVDYLFRAVELDPDFVDAYAALSEVFAVLGMYEQEFQVLEKIISIDPYNVPAHNNLGFIYGNLGMFNEAIAEFKEVITIKPDDAMVHANLAAIYSKAGYLDAAMAECKMAVSLDPDYSPGHNNLGWGYFQKGMVDEAVVEIKKAVSLDPNNADAHYNLSNIYYGSGKYALAVKHCDQAMDLGRLVEPEYLDKLRQHRY